MGRIAWVVERDDDTAYDHEARRGIASGRFLAHVEDESLPDGVLTAPDLLPLHRALRWARARSPIVIVRISGAGSEPELYSAGTEEPPWRRHDRPPRWEAHRRTVRRRRYGW